MKHFNAPTVIRNDSHIRADFKTLEHYEKQMRQMFGNTKLPNIVYKGEKIPKRILSDFSYLTAS